MVELEGENADKSGDLNQHRAEVPGAVVEQVLVVPVLAHHRHLGFGLHLLRRRLDRAQHVANVADLLVSRDLLQKLRGVACVDLSCPVFGLSNLVAALVTSADNAFPSCVKIILNRLTFILLVSVNSHCHCLVSAEGVEVRKNKTVLTGHCRIKEHDALQLIRALKNNVLDWVLDDHP